MTKVHAEPAMREEASSCTKKDAAELKEDLFRLGYPREAERALDAALKHVTLKRCRAGDVVIHEGDRPVEAYVIRRGSLRIESGRGAHAHVLAVLGAGSIVGEIGFLRATPRTATVTAVRETELFSLDERTFGRLVGSNAEFRRRLERIADVRQPDVA